MQEARGTKRSRSGDTVAAAKIDPDPDLICAICTELVVEARQTVCCATLYCKACIGNWLPKRRAGTCPSCRCALNNSKLLDDKRSDRQSADHPRNCPFHDEHGCPFVGNRNAVADHQKICLFNPDACKNPYCRTLHALEVDRQRNEQRAPTILRSEYKQEILACVWKTPEEILTKLHDLHLVKIFSLPVLNHSCDGQYKEGIEYSDPVEKYCCTVECAHHNVSIMCSAKTAVTRDRTLRFVLIHPVDPLLNVSIDIFIDKDLPVKTKRGNLNWMTEEVFKTFVKDGKFALGTRAFTGRIVD